MGLHVFSNNVSASSHSFTETGNVCITLLEDNNPLFSSDAMNITRYTWELPLIYRIKSSVVDP